MDLRFSYIGHLLFSNQKIKKKKEVKRASKKETKRIKTKVEIMNRPDADAIDTTRYLRIEQYYSLIHTNKYVEGTSLFWK